MTKFLPPVLLAALLAAIPAPACAPAPMRDQSVEITNETALIIWDKETKTEHFIRKAEFNSTSPDFGFLVPTPTKPDFSEVDDAVFMNLSTYTAPKIEYRTVRMPKPKHPKGEAKAMPQMTVGAVPPPKAAPRGVEVLDQTEVGGQEATVIKFHRGEKPDINADAKELADWLKTRGYEFGPQLVNWLKPYIENEWVMTAFRIAKRVPVSAGPGGPPRPAFDEMQGKAVRMTFKTDAPFYPYREPEEPKAPPKKPWQTHGRFLRVFFLADQRYDGTLGKGSTPWPGTQVPWSDKLNENQLREVSAKLKLPEGSLKNATWLTEFEDRSSPRQGTDEVYYKSSPDGAKQRPVIVREVIEYYDDPDGEMDAGHESKTPYWAVLVGAIGGAAFLAILGGLLYVILRNK
jgi:hypothetical protein